MCSLPATSSESDGMTMFSGLLDRVLSSMEPLAECLVLLSARRCIIVLSCRTALVRLKLLALDEDGLGSLAVPCLSAASVSIFRAGERPRLCCAAAALFSSQPAGVGGTGPRAEPELGGGRRVGGEIMGTWFMSIGCTLCDRAVAGGGPGGGGGTGIPGSHLDCDVDLDLAEVGVSIAPADAARRAAGGAT